MGQWGVLVLLLCSFTPAWSKPLQLQNPLILKLKAVSAPGDSYKEDVFSSIEKMNKESTRLMYNGDIAINAGRSAMRCAGGTCFWPKSANGLVNIPYTLSSAYAPENRSLITNAMTEFASLTCIRFVPRTNEVDYLNIFSESGCWSSMGRLGGAQDLSLDRSGCIVHGVIQHELNHALGFEHEHSRSDRDSYIKVMWDNIIPEYKDAFNKIDTNNLGLEYDYSSVMHYGKYTFSSNYLLPSIEPILNKFTPIGQRFGLSSLDVAKINRLYGCNICSSVLSDFGGTFSSASYPSRYPNNNNCTWLIRVPSDKVALQFSAFDIQTSKDCTSDYIRVFDGSSRTSPLLLDRSCGTGQMPYLVSSRNTLLVEFITDKSVTATGFRASYSTATCGGTFTAPKGEVSSPGYDQMKLYPPYADCTWTIVAPAGYQVRLEFVTFSLEDSDSCAYDSLEIRDGMLPTSPLLRTHCGRVKIPTVTSTRNALVLKMSSDNSEESTGFLANYAFVPAV